MEVIGSNGHLAGCGHGAIMANSLNCTSEVEGRPCGVRVLDRKARRPLQIDRAGRQGAGRGGHGGGSGLGRESSARQLRRWCVHGVYMVCVWCVMVCTWCVLGVYY